MDDNSKNATVLISWHLNYTSQMQNMGKTHNMEQHLQLVYNGANGVSCYNNINIQK